MLKLHWCQQVRRNKFLTYYMLMRRVLRFSLFDLVAVLLITCGVTLDTSC